MIIAIDGPSGSGKGTLASFLSHTFNLCHIDSGLLYRYAALIAEKEGVSAQSHAYAIRSTLPRIQKILKTLNMRELHVHNPNLRLESTAMLASSLAAYPEMRETVNAWIHGCIAAWNLRHDDTYNGFVIDGRDITTVVCPDALVKIYLTADVAARTQRRAEETGELTQNVEGAMKERDHRDQNRAHDPLKIGQDVHIIDTTHLFVDEVCQIGAQYVVKCCPNMASFYPC